MNDLLNPKRSEMLTQKDLQSSQFAERSMYIKEDDRDWGGAGMNDIQKDKDSE